MKNQIIVVLGLMLALAMPKAWAMGERPPKPTPDPACFASDTLRLDVGGVPFAIPRKILKIAHGENISNATGVDYPDGDDICQKENDPLIPLREIMFELTPNGCDANIHGDCVRKKMQVTLLDYRHKTMDDRKATIQMQNERAMGHYYLLYQQTIKLEIQFTWASAYDKQQLKDDEALLHSLIVTPTVKQLDGFIIK